MSTPGGPPDVLHGFAVLSLSRHYHLDVAWAFPTLPEPLRATLLARCLFREPVFGRLGSVWHYAFPVRSSGSDASASGARAHVVVVWGAVFAPEALLTLARVLGEVFVSSGSFTAVNDAWLEAFSTGAIASSWAFAKFDLSKNFRASGAKALFSGLGVETIRIYTALMTGRRVAVLGATAAEAVRAVRLIPLLVAHRYAPEPVASGTAAVRDSPASLMWPYVALSDHSLTSSDASAGGAAVDALVVALDGPLGEATRASVAAASEAALADLAGASTWVAGFTDPSVLRRGGELWDVCVDLTSRTIVEADTSKVALSLGPVHKEVAKAFVEVLGDPASNDSSVLAAVALKTSTLTSRLESWLPGGVPLGLPAAALERGYPGLPAPALSAPRPGGTDGGALILGRFADVLASQGLPTGTASTEGFLFSVSVLEPTLQARASAGVAAVLAGASAVATH